jgi:hypothetical protein
LIIYYLERGAPSYKKYATHKFGEISLIANAVKYAAITLPKYAHGL